MTWQPMDVIKVLLVAAALILVLRYAKAIIRTLAAIGGIVFLAIAAAILALAMGWWTPSLMGLLKAVVR